MSCATDDSDITMRNPAHPSSRASRAAALLEVLAAFALVHITYRAIKQLTPIGKWEAAAGTNLTPGLVMIACTAALLLLGRRDFRAYGLTLERWQENLSLGLACTMAALAFDAAGLALSGYTYDPTRPPDPYVNPPWARLGVLSAFIAAGSLAALAIVAHRGRLFRSLPAAVSIPLILGLVATLPLAAIVLHRPQMWGAALWLFLGAGFGEEIFYRGYIQSRVDHAFGRGCRWLGFDWGMGLVVSSLLFGLLHVLNTVDYFHGRFDFGWRMGLQSVFSGLFYGLVRARTGSILPGAIHHGLSDVLERLPRIIGT
jgi:membrane protease YdiL (CAAX protease family)